MSDSADFLVRLTAKTATLCCRSDTVDLDCFTMSGTTFSELGVRYGDSGQNKRSLEIGSEVYFNLRLISIDKLSTIVGWLLARLRECWQTSSHMRAKEVNFETQTNEQLLSTLLRSADKAAKIAKAFRLESLADISQDEAQLTPAAFNRLRAGIELGRRIQESKTKYRLITKISSSSDAIEFCRSHFARLITDCVQEQFHIVTLDTKNQIIDSHHITTGTLNASLVHPREVFRPAIRNAASSIILAHNHPSGDPTPSREDRAVTARLEDVGRTVGIDVLDHIVMGRDGVISIKETM